MPEILRLRELENAIGLRKSAIYAAMSDGDFPRPVRLVGRAVGWRREDVEGWLASRPVVTAEGGARD